ncbi:MAG: hypothetical protein O3C40_24130 [Planctomycetota bacterium]|nr:hypothetical protein [Planctomycetota bacterium]
MSTKQPSTSPVESVVRQVFERAISKYGAKRTNRKDASGTVRIQVMLVASGERNTKAGNITRSIRVKKAKVSEVLTAIERALFEAN